MSKTKSLKVVQRRTPKSAKAAKSAKPAARLSRARIVEALKTVYDPEIPVDIYELGLIYRIGLKPKGKIEIDMTLTAPGCPVADYMPLWVEEAVRGLPGVQAVEVQMVFDPPWDMSRMSEEARVALNMF